MLLYAFPALVTFFPDIAFIIEANASNKKKLIFLSFSNHSCINEEHVGAINQANIGAIIAPRNPSLCFIHVLLF